MKKESGLLFTAIILGGFMTALDATVVSVALPSMAETFGQGGDTSDISWILLGYTLMLCCFVLLWSKIGTNIGYPKVFVTGIAVFTVTSLLIFLTESLHLTLTMVIILRMIQGLGAGMVMAMSMALVSYFFPESQGTKMGYMTLAQSAGTAFGPALGGLLTQFDWSYIFLINVPIGIACLAICMRTMDLRAAPSERRRIDVPGAVCLFIMVSGFILFLNRGSEFGWTSLHSMAILAMGVIGALLVWQAEKRAADPIISFRLIKERSILASNVSALLLFGAMAGSYLLIPYYLEYVLGFGDMDFGIVYVGLIMIANSLGMIVVGPFVGKASDRTGKNRMFVTAGCLVGAVGFVMMSFFGLSTQVWYVLASLFVMGLGVGMALVASTNLAYRHIERSEEGLMSGLIIMFRQGGSSMGVCVLQAVLVLSIGNYVAGTSIMHFMLPGFEPAFIVAAVMAVIAAAVSLFASDKESQTAATAAV